MDNFLRELNVNQVLSGHARLTPFSLALAFLAGVLMAAAGLAYTADGRINVVHVWLLWAGLPLVGALVALLLMLFGRRKPWLFRWQQKVQWHPDTRERLQMSLVLQLWWLLAALGLLCGFLFLLLFSDLAFGWRSTLLEGPQTLSRLVSWLALPWQSWWEAAHPSAWLVESTRFFRIQPQAVEPALAGAWWPFLLASILFYNLLPRVLLLLGLWVRLRLLSALPVVVDGGTPPTGRPAVDPLQAEHPGHWQEAPVIFWEMPEAADTPLRLWLGNGGWQEDEDKLRRWLQGAGTRLVWQVHAERSPVAELADLIALAGQQGVSRQALAVCTGPATDEQRHLASWRLFAARHQLIWLGELDHE